MGTSLIASLDTHRSISRYVTSLLAKKSHSSRHEQNASLIARSSSFFLLAQETTAFAHLLGVLCPRACGSAVELGIPIPSDQRSWMFAHANINGVARCQDSHSPSEVPCHCHMQGEPYKTPATTSPTQKYQSIVTQIYLTKIPHIGKWSRTPMFYTTLTQRQ